jgi:uncharacterized protein (TIGR03435 family)
MSVRSRECPVGRLGKAVCSLVAALVVIPATTTLCQEQPPRLTFDVAVIRPGENKGGGGIKPLPGGNGYTVLNANVRLMISLMYKVPVSQIIGGAAWLDSDPYDIEAKADGSHSIDDLHTMFQNLLADRFHLRFHKETREGPVYALTIDKSGLKMKPNLAPQDYKVAVTPNGFGIYAGTRVPMNYLAWFLGQQLQPDGRPVIDRTGLTGNYDFTLFFATVHPSQKLSESNSALTCSAKTVRSNILLSTRLIAPRTTEPISQLTTGLGECKLLTNPICNPYAGIVQTSPGSRRRPRGGRRIRRVPGLRRSLRLIRVRRHPQ